MDCFFKLFVIGIPIIVALGLNNERRKRRRLELYGNLAKGLRMKFDEGTLLKNRRIYGKYNGHIARVEDAGGRNLGYIVTLESKSQFTGHLTLEKPGYGELGPFLIRTGFSLREGVIEFDDEAFDKKVVARTNNPEFFKNIIDPEIRKAILGLNIGKITIKGGKLTYETTGYMPNNLANIKRALNVLHSVEQKLSGGRTIAAEPVAEPVSEPVGEFDEGGLLKF